MQNLFILFLSVFLLPSCSSDSTEKYIPVVQKHSYVLGDNIKHITVRFYGKSNRFTFIKLHDNEITSEQAAHKILEEYGGVFINIENEKQRNISFSLRGKTYTFDPNRMFTASGITNSVSLYSKYSATTLKPITGFADFLLSKVPAGSIIVALHNNTGGNYSLLDYLNNGSLKKEVKEAYRFLDIDADDFIYTTDEMIYNYFKEKNFNAVLQDNKNVTDDGSLSVYCGKKGITYINIEAEYGHLEEQAKMLKILMEAVK